MTFFKINNEKQSEALRKARQRHAANCERIERNICASISSGSISLQNGEYITSNDLDSVQEFLADYFLKEKRCRK